MSDLALADLRRLLDLALTTDGPTPIALARLGGEVTIGKLARAYLPHWLPLTWAPGVGIDTTDRGPYHLPAMLVAMHQNGAQTLDPTDPATCHAVLVALALSYGLDPGPMGCGVSLGVDGPGWRLEGTAPSLDVRACVWFEDRDQEQLDDMTDPGGGPDPIDAGHTLYIHAPEIASIPADNIAEVLTAMVRHRLAETP